MTTNARAISGLACQDWRDQLERDIVSLHGSAPAPAITRLLDTRHRPLAEARLTALPDDHADPWLAYARGRASALGGRREDALTWYARAQASCGVGDVYLVARIAFEIGSLHFTAGQLGALAAVIAWAERMLAESGQRMADLFHIRALRAELAGDSPGAELFYRSAIEGGDALTPLTRVLAIRNFATLVNHSLPREAVGFCELGLSQVDAGELDRRYRARLLTVLSYAAICAGDVIAGDRHARAAAEAATASGSPEIEPFALFNRSISLELQGKVRDAQAELRGVEAEARHVGSPLAEWALLRQGWLHFMQADLGHARDIAERLRKTAAADLTPALDVLFALIALHDGSFARARARLKASARHYMGRGDELTTFVLGLWCAYLEHLAGSERAARRELGSAIELARLRRFTVSPNWWCDDLALLATGSGDADVREYAAALHRSGSPRPPSRHAAVVVSRDGTISMTSGQFGSDTWRQGKTGARVLRRYFALLSRSHPAGVTRDDLVDELWPDSDGDRAIRNLHAATHDLRRVLSTIRGLTLSVDDRVYRLRCGDNVRIQDGADRTGLMEIT